jgi:hypothetical protein
MTTTQIILAVLSSSVLSAVLTSLANYYIQKSNYKNEYYKKILDKRIYAYEEVESLLIKTRLHLLDHENQLIYSYLFDTIEELDKTIYAIAFVNKNSIWLSSDIGWSLTELNTELMNIETEAKRFESPDLELHRIGFERMDKIRILRKQIETYMKRDFINLHDIDLFLNEMFSKKERKNIQIPLS